MILTIERYETGENGTFGRGHLDADPFKSWDFIELQWLHNMPDYSCVPAGSFRTKLVDSPHFHRKVYLLLDVPDREYCEMHPANWAGDRRQDLCCQLRGCCAPGKARGIMKPPDFDKLQPCVLQSGEALDEIIALAGDDLTIVFTWAPGMAPE